MRLGGWRKHLHIVKECEVVACGVRALLHLCKIYPSLVYRKIENAFHFETN